MLALPRFFPKVNLDLHFATDYPAVPYFPPLNCLVLGLISLNLWNQIFHRVSIDRWTLTQKTSPGNDPVFLPLEVPQGGRFVAQNVSEGSPTSRATLIIVC